jgi:hypothetical protein
VIKVLRRPVESALSAALGVVGSLMLAELLYVAFGWQIAGRARRW